MKPWNEPVKILVIGDLITDVDIHGTCSRFAQESPGCPVFVETRDEERMGGAGAVAMMCAGLNGSEVYENVKLIYGDDTSIKTRHFVDGRQVWRHDNDAKPLSAVQAAELTDDVCGSFDEKWDAVLIADYGKGACVYPAVRMAIEKAAYQNIPCLVDPAHGVDWRTYRGATAIKCNWPEWCKAGGDISRGFDGRPFWCQHVPVVVSTRGELGMTYHTKHGSSDYAARPSKLVDVTGAGDMTLAALGVCLARGMSWDQACRFAAIASGMKVERRGAVPVPLADILAEFKMD